VSNERAKTVVNLGRPRSFEAHQAILQATLELLAEIGFYGLTVEGVAARAGVGKATIYRRWPSKLPLVIEAMRGLPDLPCPDTGTLVDDLEQLLTSFVEILTATPLAHVLPSLAGERNRDRDLASAMDEYVTERRQPIRNVLERARQRGEIRDDLDVELAIDLIMGPVVTRLFFTGGVVTTDEVAPMVALALSGLRQ
jgi:AcrR family transcriptional regulator